MQPSDSRPPVGRGSGRPWPVAYPVPRATRRKKGLLGAWAVLFQRAVGSDPAGCASRRAHRVETAIAFRLHNALGTQNERYFVAVNPTAHSLACLRIGVFVTADAARLATGVGGSPFTGRVSHPLDGEQSFMTSPHRHSPLTSLAWSHYAPTPHAAGVPTRFLHDCRRTAARNLIRANVPERVAMLLTGHKSRAIFDRYNIIHEQELLDAGDQLVAYLAQQAQPMPARRRPHPAGPAAPRTASPLRLVRRTTA